MSTFREFATGFELGQQQRKQVQRDKAVSEADSMFKSGNYEGAESALMAYDPQMAAAYGQAGDRRKTAERQKMYGDAFKAGGLKSVRDTAGQQGDYATAADLEGAIAKMDDQQRALAAAKAGFLADTSVALSQIKDPAQRKAAFDQIIATSGAAVGITPQQAAGFDLSDQNLQAFYQSSMSVKDQLEMRDKANKAPTTTMDGTMMWDAEQRKYVPVPGAVEQYGRLQRQKPSAQGGAKGGLTANQEFQAQFKLDDLDRELAAAEKKRKSDLSTVTSSLALLDEFISPENRKQFNAVYGNMINPTGEGDDLFNWKVSAATDPDRANGMAILEQLGGRAFLDSVAAMKGTGALSDREGARVTAAATRLMQANQSDEAAMKAATEFRAALVSYKSALEQDIAESRKAETARRAQMQTMLGRTPAAEPDDLDAHIDSLFDSSEIDQGIEDAAASPTGSGQVPAEAAADLMRDPSPEARREFDDIFGTGMAERVLNASR